MRRRASRVLAFLAAFLSTCAWAAQAEAGTVSLILQDTAPGSFTELRLTYQAAPGEWNRLSISMTFDQRTWIVSETVAGVTITAGEGCTSVTAQIATCSVPEGATELFYQVVVDLSDSGGGMADGVDASGACGRFIHPTEFLCAATIDGGEGGDVLRGPDVGGCELRGGPGVDNLSGGRVEGPENRCILDGGPGADFIAGGGRAGDVVSYRDRVNPVRVSLGPRRNNDGEVGEHDTVVGVRNVWTGAGDDVVVGDSHANWVFAGAGRDLVGAGGGNDDVTGGPGPGRGLCGVDGHDRIFGGFGNDILRGCADNDRIDGGPGRDLASGDRGNDTLRGDRGRDTLKGRVGNDILLARDGQVDRVGGGTGYDRARIDLGLDTRSSIERLF